MYRPTAANVDFTRLQSIANGDHSPSSRKNNRRGRQIKVKSLAAVIFITCISLATWRARVPVEVHKNQFQSTRQSIHSLNSEKSVNHVYKSENSDFSFRRQPVIHLGSSESRFLSVSNKNALLSDDCQPFHAPGSNVQICCNQDSKWYCYPNLIIAGAQKGGTTALHSYLLFHPELIASRKKELHVFDVDKNYMKYPKSITASFTPTNILSVSNHINYESTPSYLAGPLSCQRMAQDLPDATKLVMIVRNPVERAWSEIQMKARRIESQTMFLNLYDSSGLEIATCIRKTIVKFGISDVPPTKSVGMFFTSCMRQYERTFEFMKHAKFPLFVRKGLLGYLNGKLTIEECFGVRSETLQSTGFMFGTGELIRDQSVTANRDCLRKSKLFQESMPSVPQIFRDELRQPNLAKCLQLGFVNTTQKMYSQTTPIATNVLQHLHKPTKSSLECRTLLREKICSLCYQKPSFAQTLDDAHASERIGLKDCLRDCVDKQWPGPIKTEHNCAFPLLGFGSTKDLLSDDSHSMSQCVGSYCTCFPPVRMPSDISKGFVFRGLYHIHLGQCLQHLRRDRILIVENQELRRNPQRVLDEITEFVGIEKHNFEQYSSEELHSMFTETYPTFESVTGWSMAGSYEQIDQNSKDLLRRVFYEPNESFFEMIGKRYDWND